MRNLCSLLGPQRGVFHRRKPVNDSRRGHRRERRRAAGRRCLAERAQKNDTKAIGAVLDEHFSWTNENGRNQTRAQFLGDSAAISAAGGTEYAGVQAHDYGQLAVVTGTSKRSGHADTFFARVWVKRPAGWRLLHSPGTRPFWPRVLRPRPHQGAGKDAARSRSRKSVPHASGFTESRKVRRTCSRHIRRSRRR